MKSSTAFGFRIAVVLAGVAIIGGGIASAPAAANDVRSILQNFGIIACNSSSPCAEIQNFGSGAAIKGDGTSGPGIVASAQSASGLSSTANSGEGVTAMSNFNNGVRGVTNNASSQTRRSLDGVIGVDASSDGGALNAGVRGFSTNGDGIQGQSFNNSGVVGTSNSPGGGIIAGVLGIATQGNTVGVWGQANGGAGVVGQAMGTANPGVFGMNMGGGDGIDAFSNGIALDAFNQSGDAFPAALIIGGTTSSSGTSLETFDNAASATFWVDNGGNAHVRGLLFTGGSCSVGCSRTAGKSASFVQRYVPEESSPSIEDMGEAQLVHGSAYVRIGADFANVIDRHSSYLVFVTPQGPTRGLYVANKSVGGFEVHEISGGTASIAFDYRIVAKPFGVDAQRLPLVSGPQLPGSPRAHRIGRELIPR
jgi:hypothetical protein